MKKALTLSSLLLLTLVMSSCRVSFGDESDTSSDSSSSTASSSSTDTSSTTSSTTSSSTTEPSSTTSTPEKVLKTITYETSPTTYYAGQTMDEMLQLKVIAVYTDGSREDVTDQITDYRASLSYEGAGEPLTNLSVLHRAGKYEGEFSYKLWGQKYGMSFSLEVHSSLHDVTKEITSLEITDFKDRYTPGEKFDKASILVKAVYNNDEERYEIINYSDEFKNRLELALNLGNSKENLIDSNLYASSELYSLTVKDTKTKITSSPVTFQIQENTGYVKVDEMSFKSTDVNPSFSPSKGDVKFLVVPIQLDETPNGKVTTTPYNDDLIGTIHQQYFTDEQTTDYTLKGFYKTASFGQLNVDGMIADVYHETTYTADEINSDTTIGKLIEVFDRAATWVVKQHPEVNWDEYDGNKDGYFDNIIFFTNADEGVDWSDPLWPHKSNAYLAPTDDRLGVNTYCTIEAGYYPYSTVTIHEQGHIFGLDDYYDYSGTLANYVGCADMQSMNIMDWNSFSKLLVDWVDPYVIDGTKDTTTITLQAAAKNGDCLLIPADYSTWNGSGYDEYFLLELFSPYGNNAIQWDYYNYAAEYSDPGFLGLNSYGVRLYHVNAQIYGANLNGNYIEINENKTLNSKEELRQYNYPTLLTSNSVDTADYLGFASEKHQDEKLLTLIQKGKVDTFGALTDDPNRRWLSDADLFKEGDTFTFSEYSHFLSKTGVKKTTMDNGETFPYTIHFDKMSQDQVTVTVSKTK